MKTLKELIHGLEILGTSGNMDVAVTDICSDSRRVTEGNLFVCVPGSRFDGNAFAGEAVAKGAVALVSEAEPAGKTAAAYVRVPDIRKALAALAINFFGNPSRGLQLIGITGTNGKTTTSLLIESILRSAGCTPGVLGTLAYRWGNRELPASMTTPDSLELQRIFHEMLRDGVSHVVMEVSSHALALGRIAGCTFRTGVFTNLSQDHLDFHSSMEDYFAAKKLLFSDYLDPHRSAAVLNADDPYGRRILENGAPGNHALGYSAAVPSMEDAAGVFARKVQFTPHGIHALIGTPRGDIEIESSLVGRLNLYNVLAAVSAAFALGIPFEAIADGIRAVSHVDGRLQRVEVPASCGFHVIVDYAHTPDAVEKALTCLREMEPGRLIAVLGCGGDRDRGKRPIMGRIAAQKADLVIVTSDNPRTEDPAKILDQVEAGIRETGVRYFEPTGPAPAERCYTTEIDRRKAIELALAIARPGDILFIGGKGHETYQIIGTTKYPFDDRLVVKDYFRNHPVSD